MNPNKAIDWRYVLESCGHRWRIWAGETFDDGDVTLYNLSTGEDFTCNLDVFPKTFVPYD